MTTMTSWSASHSLNDIKVVSRFSQSPPLMTPPVCSDFATTRYASGLSGFRSSLLNRTFWWPAQVHGGSQSNTLYSTRCQHRSEEHTSELQSLRHLVCRLLLE